MRGRTKEESACRKSVTRSKDRRKDIIKGRALMRGLTVTDLAKTTITSGIGGSFGYWIRLGEYNLQCI